MVGLDDQYQHQNQTPQAENKADQQAEDDREKTHKGNHAENGRDNVKTIQNANHATERNMD